MCLVSLGSTKVVDVLITVAGEQSWVSLFNAPSGRLP